jgi:hypothetical protein
MDNNYEKKVIFVILLLFFVVVKTTENSTGNPKTAPTKFSPVYRYVKRTLWTRKLLRDGWLEQMLVVHNSAYFRKKGLKCKADPI